jgi:hypothetical protein
MRELSMSEFDHVGGGGWFSRFFMNVWRAGVFYAATALGGPVAGALVGAGLGAIDWNIE